MFFPMTNVSYFHISAFQSMCAVASMAVFCSSLVFCIPSMLFRYFVNDFEMVQVALLLLVSHLFLHSTYAVFLM
jgi:hypothetical protein